METCATQLKAFQNIITLATRFPGLRHMFILRKTVQKAETSKGSIIEFWKGGETSSKDFEWNFFFEFAASCVVYEANLARLLEGSYPNDLVCLSNDGRKYRVIEQLLVASDSWYGTHCRASLYTTLTRRLV